jgi:DNA repair protein RadD
MDIELRQYQQEALNTILGAIPHQSEILIQASTGAGKTIIFCKLIETILTKWPQVKIGILAHRKELITQAQDKLLRVWPDAPIGLACASTGETVALDKPVVIGCTGITEKP